MRTGGPERSREATDRLLALPRDGHWMPTAWARFAGATVRRSVAMALARPRVLVEVTALHATAATVARYASDERAARTRWVVASWALSVTHLGMLEARTSLGLANTLTLARANLPAAGARIGPAVGVIAACTDAVDGRFARRTATETPFGQYADAFADAGFWIWYASRYGNAALVGAAWLTWLGPTVAVTARSIARGAMVDPPRPRWIRPAATLQVVLAVYGLLGRRAIGRPTPRCRTRTQPGS